MPELPEVETMRRGIAAITGSTIVGVERLPCARRPILVRPGMRVFQRRVVGQAVAGVERLGKRVVIRLTSEDRMLFEPRMTGLVLVADPPSQDHLRFRLDLEGGRISHVWYWDRRGLGNVQLLSAQEFAQQLGSGRLGPDALSIDVGDFRERLRRSRRAIKVALLDQRAVAGIGNLYAAEILHLAKIDPRVRCTRLRLADWERIYAAMQEVLQAAILHEGSTLSDGTYRNALNKAGGYQNHHRVYDRAGELCGSCRRQVIERIVQAQRSTFFCRACQGRR